MKTNVVNVQFDTPTPLPPRAQAFRPRTMNSMYTCVAKAQCAAKSKSRPGTYQLYPLRQDQPRQRINAFFLHAKAPSAKAYSVTAQRIKSEEHYPRSSPVTAQPSKASLRDAATGIAQFPELHKSLPTLYNSHLFAPKAIAQSTLKNSVVAPERQGVGCLAQPFPSLPSGVFASEPTVQNFAMALPNESQMVRFEAPGLQFAYHERCEFFNDNSSVTTVDEAESS